MIRKKKREYTPLLLQMEANECGAASLGIIAGYYGKFLPLEELRQLCNITRDGSNGQNVIAAAEKLGMEGTGYSYAPEEVITKQAPLILHWGFSHFLVYEGYDEKKNEVCLNDPAQGHRNVSWQEFEENYTGIVLCLRPGADFVKSGEPENVWGDLLNSMLLHKQALAFILAVGLAMAIVNLYVPVLSQVFFDSVVTYKNREWLFEICLGMLIAIGLRFVLELVRGWCMVRWQGILTVNDSADILNHILHLPVEFFQQRYAAEIASRVQFTENVANFVSGNLATVALDAGIAIFYLLLLFLYDVRLTVIGIIFTLANCGVTWYVFRWFKEQQMKIQQEQGRLWGLSASGIAAMETLKANGNEGDFFVKWANYNARFMKMSQEREYIGLFLNCVPAILSAVSGSLVMLFGGLEIINGIMTVGIFVAFQNLMGNFQQPVQRIINMSQGIQEMQSQMMKLRDVKNYPAEAKIEKTADIPFRLKGELEFKTVSFNYGRTGKPLIKRLNLHIPSGNRVAVVGASGSGKSTAARLACGFYKPWSGDILFDGISFSQIPREVLANSVAVVEQETVLFAGTVADNITLFNKKISREDIIKAAKAAEIHEDILRMNGGYEAKIIEGGSNLSGGQCQRLSIARALVQSPSLLILDEATSAIDPVTEKAIMNNIRRIGCSCLMIAHRLSTVRDCDEIIVLERGRVAERGNHASLLEKNGAYVKLMQDNS